MVYCLEILFDLVIVIFVIEILCIFINSYLFIFLYHSIFENLFITFYYRIFTNYYQIIANYYRTITNYYQITTNYYQIILNYYQLVQYIHYTRILLTQFHLHYIHLVTVDLLSAADNQHARTNHKRSNT